MTDESRTNTSSPPTSAPGGAAESAGVELKAGDRLAHFVLHEILGQGGMGRVFRAFDENLQRDVALKVMLPDLSKDEKLRRRFLREARAMAALNHHHVVTIHHVDDTGPVPFFVMPLLRGESLYDRLVREKVLPVADVIRIGRQTAEGLAHAHDHPLDLIHRDVKPGNVWLEEGTGHVKILDFGLVRMGKESTHLTQPGQIYGTPDFMSPEQWAGEELDHRCDQYALGCVLYLASTGKAPRGRFRDPDALNSDVPRGLSDLIVRLLAQLPDERYASMRDVAEELSRLGLARAVAASPATPVPTSAAVQTAAAVPATPTVPLVPVAVSEASLARTAPLPPAAAFTNSIGMRFVLIPAGTFLMGATKAEDNESSADEGPRHKVAITKAFYLGVCPVTQGQWRAVMGTNPSWFSAAGGGAEKVKGLDVEDFPVEQTSWDDAQEFLKKLTGLREEAKQRRQYRLPSEAEWEYACRGGGRQYVRFSFGNSISARRANFGNHLGHTSKVGVYEPNRLGLHDIHGNVWEWCQDWYAGDYSRRSPQADPEGPEEGTVRVHRGGCWAYAARRCRTASRHGLAPSLGSYYVGFRAVVMVAE